MTLTNCSGVSLRTLNGERCEIQIPPQILSCVMCIKHFSPLTKAVHGTAWNTSAAGLQVLRSCLGSRDLSSKVPQNKHSWEEQFCHLAFATSKVQIARVTKTRVASKTSKTITAWWLASSLRSTLLAVQCQINDQKLELSWHSRPRLPWAYLGSKWLG